MARPVETDTDLVTVDEFYRLVPDGQKADLIDGVIHMASPDTLRANELTGFVYWLLQGFVGAHQPGGKVLVNRYAFELTEIRAPEPDVAYVRPERAHLATQRGMRGGPDIAVEIVSRESRHRDYHEKRQLYQDAGVSEYWIVDPIQQRVEFLVLEQGRYELAPLEQNRVFRSRALPGFWIDVDWLLADPLPNGSECLQSILTATA
ncbi:MAG: Uma2 family endonuclease [Pirellulales bacterium]|nr:Uma2 family endonuclease [Pirellulales bacterium]